MPNTTHVGRFEKEATLYKSFKGFNYYFIETLQNAEESYRDSLPEGIFSFVMKFMKIRREKEE